MENNATSHLPPHTVEIIKDTLYFSSSDAPERVPVSSTWLPFANDASLVYTAFFADFGPLDLGLTYRFCTQLRDKLAQAHQQHKSVVYFASSEPQKRSNSAVLLLSYLIFVLNYSVPQAYGPFIGIQPPFIPFRDAGFCINTFSISVLDHCMAMHKAKTAGHFSFRTFSLTAYQNLAKLQNGDVSWIVPGKFIAFSGPVTKRRQLSPGVFTLTPEQYVPLFKNLGVTCVVRFNDKCYDRKVFLNGGIRHVDLFYEDGGNPTESILQAFLSLCESEKGAIAVHCKAGLGRTGTNIAAYMMKHYGYTARESIAWCRHCRPGCIVGPQQQFLLSIEDKMFAEGQAYREKNRLHLPSSMNKQPSNSNNLFANSNNNTNDNGLRRGSSASAKLAAPSTESTPTSSLISTSSLSRKTGSTPHTPQTPPVQTQAAQAQTQVQAQAQNKAQTQQTQRESNIALPRPSTSGGNFVATSSRSLLLVKTSSTDQSQSSPANVPLSHSDSLRPKTSHGGPTQAPTLSQPSQNVPTQRPPTSPTRRSITSQDSSTVNSSYNAYLGTTPTQKSVSRESLNNGERGITLTKSKSKLAWSREDDGVPLTPTSAKLRAQAQAQAQAASLSTQQKTSSSVMPPISANGVAASAAVPRPRSQQQQTRVTSSVSRSLDSASAKRRLLAR